jgi:putative ABC transport system permease protein
MSEFGNPQDDNTIYIPIDTAQNIFNKKNEVNMIELMTKDGISMSAAAKKAERALLKERGEKLSASRKNKLNFQVTTPDQLLGQLNNVLLIVQAVLVSIAAISLVVGAIGIMNSMYTNVLERTKEIGVMKSVGAKHKDILKVFLIESAIIGFIGGLIGVIFGIGLSKLIESYAIEAGFSFLKIGINYPLIVFSVLFAMIIGMLAGYLPASKAAKLEVVEALRG